MGDSLLGFFGSRERKKKKKKRKKKKKKKKKKGFLEACKNYPKFSSANRHEANTSRQQLRETGKRTASVSKSR